VAARTSGKYLSNTIRFVVDRPAASRPDRSLLMVRDVPCVVVSDNVQGLPNWPPSARLQVASIRPFAAEAKPPSDPVKASWDGAPLSAARSRKPGVSRGSYQLPPDVVETIDLGEVLVAFG
jgi:hypothetical protein